MKKIFSLLFVLLLYGCITYDPPRGGIMLLNYSDSAIYVYKECEDSIKKNILYEDDSSKIIYELKLFEKYPDTIEIGGKKLPKIISPDYRVDAYSYGFFITGGTPKKPRLGCEDKSIRLFIVKESTMRTKTWDEIIEGQLYDAKIVKTEEELNKEGWEIVYMPDKLQNGTVINH